MATAVEPLADLSDGNVAGNPPGVVSASVDAPVCAAEGCDGSAVPGSSFCGAHQADGDKGQGSPNGGPDGSYSDGTNPGSDPASGYQDGTLRVKPRRRGSGTRLARLHDVLDRNPYGELRSEQVSSSTVSLTGTAIVYGVRTLIWDAFGVFGETIQRGAAAHLLDGDVRLLANHEGLTLARTTSSTLALKETPYGVTFAAELDVDSPLARTVASGVKRRDLTGMSFAFSVNESGESWNSTMTERTIVRFSTLPEVSVVSFPAYESTSVAARKEKAIAAQRSRIAHVFL